MSAVTKAPKLFAIPAGTIPTTCKSCREQIYFAEQPSGSKMPIEVRGDVPGSLHPSMSTPGMGIAHFIHCPAANLHRKGA